MNNNGYMDNKDKFCNNSPLSDLAQDNNNNITKIHGTVNNKYLNGQSVDPASVITQAADIKEQKLQTKRIISLELEEILGQPIQVLDHGFIRVIDYMGNDNSVTQAARVSYGEGTKTLQNDTALINYLMKHAHTSPFEMCEIKFHIKAPIFIARQWVRHRTANINEYSGRYSVMSENFYVPDKQHIMEQSMSNKQGRENSLPDELNELVTENITDLSKQAFKLYKKLLNLNSDNSSASDSDSNKTKKGIARELARIILPLNTYTEFYWKIDLHNLLHFLHLRSKVNAQYEIRVYAEAMLSIVKKWVPIIYQAFMNYKYYSTTISQECCKVIRDLINNGTVNKSDYSLSKREWIELEKTFQLKYN